MGVYTGNNFNNTQTGLPGQNWVMIGRGGNDNLTSALCCVHTEYDLSSTMA